MVTQETEYSQIETIRLGFFFFFLLATTCRGGTMVDEQCRESDGDKRRESETNGETNGLNTKHRERERERERERDVFFCRV